MSDRFRDAPDDASTLGRPAVARPSMRSLSFVLTILEGADAGAVHRVGGDGAQGPALVGEPGGLRITDLRSRNGTSVNGVQIVEALLQGGETIRFGDTLLRVTRDV